VSSPPAVVLVEPSEPGNVGTVARSMKNFGLSDLRLVDPPELDRDGPAYGFAGSAREDVLPEATETRLEAVVENFYTVGFTATTNEDDRKHVRYPFVDPAGLAEELAGVEADTALVFGRERVGLTNEELARLDRICSIPASAAYPTLNLGQAATIACYECRHLAVEETQHPDGDASTAEGDDPIERADEEKIERLYDRVGEYLDAVGHPPEKRSKTLRLLRRVIGRAHPTGREATTLLGLFRRGIQRASGNADTTESPDATERSTRRDTE
jgi:tRNA (cytidine32/uridine32-2'-O)-methyltransferase